MRCVRERVRGGRWQSLAALPVLAALGLGLAMAGCNTGSGGVTSTLTPGSVVLNPDTGLFFIVDPNNGGSSNTVRMFGQARWGRLVDVFDLDGAGNRNLIFADFVVGQDIFSDGIDFELDRNPVTEKDVLTVLHQMGSPGWDAAFSLLEFGLQPVLDKSLDPNELPPYTALPRNSAMVLQFDDLLDDGGNLGSAAYPGTVKRENVKVLVGYPPESNFDYRVLPDANHGDLIGGTFHSTRVIIDTTVSKIDAQNLGLTINAIGLPEAITKSQPNVVLRIPTRTNSSVSQFEILTNLAGRGLGLSGNGSSDPFSPTLDVVRAVRSGGRTAVTGDANNGFLPDAIPPSVVGAQSVDVTLVSPSGNDFLLNLTFQTVACAIQPMAGDVVEFANVVTEVLADGAPPIAGQVSGVRVGILGGSGGQLVPGPATFRAPWNPALGSAPECFVQFSPPPLLPPASGVRTDSAVVLTFSEPIDPESVRIADTFNVLYSPPPASPLQLEVVGNLSTTNDLTEFSLIPVVPLKHTSGAQENYIVSLTSGANGVTDLAGNALEFPLPPATFKIAAGDATVQSGSISLKFTSTDEDLNGFPELRGQFLPDLVSGRILPRPVQRFSAEASTVHPVVGAMVPNPLAPVFNPLTSHGSIVQTVWRYHDLGLGVIDDATLNIDVEGLSWSPVLAGLQIDNFPAFRLGLTHGRFLPDEAVDAMTGMLAYPLSGLMGTFVDNLLTPLTIVHPKPLGYTVLSGDFFQAPSGLNLAPWPLNRNLPVENFTLWTWRDTAIQAVGGVGSGGADTDILLNIVGGQKYYQPGQVPTVGLPMLMEFRTYANTVTAGNNQMSTISATGTGFPAFRAHSTGGVLSNGNAANVDPDQEISARGNIVTGTPGLDDTFYLGGADFVVRVNRVHTIWLNTGGVNNFGPGVIQPSPTSLPTGTSVQVHYRGATSINNPANAADANNIDPYGNRLATGAAFTATFLNGDRSWKASPTLLGGATYIQARVTLISNHVSQVSPDISFLGIGFFQ